MSYDSMNEGGLDYFHCRYGGSPNLFRGPEREIRTPFIVSMGGTETYGRFIRTPFPHLLESILDCTVINLGAVNSSVDLYLNDQHLIEMANMAQLTVVQITGAHNVNNRFYTVHPRRNDRFVAASALLRSMYREVDFTEFNFTRHLLHTLHKRSPERFEIVVDELRQSWMSRMRLMLGKIHSPVLLVLLARDKLPTSTKLGPGWLARDPLLVTQDMVRALSPNIARYVEVFPPSNVLVPDLEGMVYAELEAPAAKEALPPNAHRFVAEALAPALEPFLKS